MWMMAQMRDLHGLNERLLRTHTPHAVMEAALAHTVRNKAEAAYARSDLFEKRRALMDVSGCVEVRINGGHRFGAVAINCVGDDSERRVGV